MLVVVDSRHRATGTVDDYYIDLKFPYPHTTLLTLKAAMVPKSMYPIVADFNDTIATWTGESAFTVAPGNYTGAELATLLTAHDSDITVTYDDNTHKLSFANAGSTKTLTAGAAASRVFGFDPATGSFAATGSATVVAPFQVNLAYPTRLRLGVTIQGDRGELVRDTEANYSFQVDMNANFGDYVYQSEHEAYRQADPVSDHSTSRLHIKWSLPDDLAVLDFQGIDHVLVFEVQ